MLKYNYKTYRRKSMYNSYQQRVKRRTLFEIVECLKKGMNTKQIAEELNISVRTAQRHIKYIRENQEEE